MRKYEVLPLLLSLKSLLQDNMVKEAEDLIHRLLIIRDDSDSCEGQEASGMTELQYKGMLLDQLDCWERVLKLAKEADLDGIRAETEKHIALIQQKLCFGS